MTHDPAAGWDPMLANLGHGQWIWEPQAGCWRLSPTCARLLGYEQQETTLGADGWLPQVHADDRARLSACLQDQGTKLDGPWQCEFRRSASDDDEHWLLSRGAVVTRDADGAAVCVIGTCTDMTSFTRTSQAVHARDQRLSAALESKFQDAMEHTRMAWFERDLATDEMRGSRSLWQIYGFDPAQQPLHFSDIISRIHADDVPAHPAATAVLRARSRALHGVPTETATEVLIYRVLPDDKDVRWIEVRYRQCLDGLGGGTVSGLVVDVTAAKRAELEHDRLHRQLQQAQKMESIGLLTGGIAHDFNNILASILGYSGLALQRFADRVPEKLVDYLKEVQIAGGRARDLVAQMLAFSRGESDELVSMNIDRVLDQTIKMLRPTLPTSIEIVAAVDAGLPAVLADPVRLQQVVLNLCINARDAMAGTGNIELSLRRREIRQGHCASCHHEFDGDFVVLGVADDGPGIPEVTQSRIFEPFFSTKAAGRGTGMGLAMVHGIVHHHQGHILLHTAPDSGCVFEILLPLEQSARPLSAYGEAVDIASYEASRPTQVLVVDDERAVASFVAELLELNGYTVTVTTDPLQAWDLIDANPKRFDLVITDQTMPRLTGAQLAARVIGVRADLPVVLMTGYSATIDERRARELGIRAYLRKPVRGDELLAAIASAVEQKSAA